MSLKEDLKAELTKLNIAFEDSMTNAELKSLLPEGDAVKTEEETDNGFVVQDPEILRPKVLPLVITLPEGQSWKNPEQEAYARILNAAAYCNPESWNRLQVDANGRDIPNSAPKDIELKRLAEIGTNPAKFYVHTGTQKEQPGNLTYRNDLLK